MTLREPHYEIGFKNALVQLDGKHLAHALTSGIHKVIGEQDLLNRINVFPVADGDTGTNMSLSLGAVLDILGRPDELHIGRLLTTVADVLLDNSRGNSGALIAQFFQGMSDSAADLQHFTTATFGRAAAKGSMYAHDALSDPREGTILSVMAAFAQTICHHSSNEHDFKKVLKFAMQHIDKALHDTTEQLEVLRKAGVVDAGAKGFVALMAGMTEFIAEGRIAAKPDVTDLLLANTSAGSTEADSEYRYCTECIVNGTDIDRRKLREALAGIGDSLVLAGTKRKAKVHIHVDNPDDVFTTAREFGEVSATKADDMHRQQHSSHHTGKHFAVITDSAADIADDDLDRLDIHMVPCRIQFGSRGYLDKVSITAEEFYAELDSNPEYPTTSQPSPGDYRRQLQFLASHFPDVVLLSITARASGALQAARSAAARIDGPGRVHVIDSRNASSGQGLLAVFAAECAAAGLSVHESIAAVEALIPKTHTYALVPDLSHAVRGGRVGKSMQTLATLFRVTPIIRTVPDGRVATGGFVLGKKNLLRKFARFIARRTRQDEPLTVTIGHALCLAEARKLEALMRDALPAIKTLTITELGPALGAHGGRGSLIVATQPYRAPGKNSG